MNPNQPLLWRLLMTSTFDQLIKSTKWSGNVYLIILRDEYRTLWRSELYMLEGTLSGLG